MHARPPKDDTLVAFDEAMLALHRSEPANLAMPYTSVCGGFFHKLLAGRVVEDSPYYTPQNLALAQRLRVLEAETGHTVTQLLLAFFFRQDFACVPLYGPRSAADLAEAMAAPDCGLPADAFTADEQNAVTGKLQ
jgi:aryl-alcohol dehydrogenase-like predicted oxidoreductase